MKENHKMFIPKNRLPSKSEERIRQIRKEARGLYESRQLLCAEAVVVALNDGLGGGLSHEQAIAQSAPFCMALGESGCLCGALSGAAMATGLILGTGQPYRQRANMRKNARQLHDAFKSLYGATCCRVLCREVRKNKSAHFRQCADLTAGSAEMAARLILQKRPDLADMSATTVSCRTGPVKNALLRLVHFLWL